MSGLDIAIIGLIVSIIGLLVRLTTKVQTDIKESLKREYEQSNKISDCRHKIELLDQKLEAYYIDKYRIELEAVDDKYELAINGLLERFEHSKKRLEGELKSIEDKL